MEPESIPPFLLRGENPGFVEDYVSAREFELGDHCPIYGLGKPRVCARTVVKICTTGVTTV
jgi:hypothetical protein